MSETGFRIFNQAFSAGAELTYAALLTAFFRPFVPQDKRRCGLLLVFFVYILFEIVCNRAALPQGSFLCAFPACGPCAGAVFPAPVSSFLSFAHSGRVYFQRF